jgi:membrane fusion protein (multidrug efflux system)
MSDQQGNQPTAADAPDDQKADAKASEPSLFSKPLFWIVVVGVVAAIAIGGTLYYLHARQYESTDDAFVDAHIVRISPTVAGTLRFVADKDNRHVEPGQLLAEDLARYEALHRLDPNAVAAQKLDEVRAQARSTAADAVAAQRQVDSADAQITVARRQIGAARAVIAARQAQTRQARVSLGDNRLVAPIAGQLVNRQVNVGSYVGPGTQLMAIVPDHVWVTANFKETQLRHMRIGDSVTIQVDAYPDVAFKGHVDSVQRGAGQAFAILPPQNSTGNYVKVVQRVPVRIEFDAKGGPDPRKYPIGPGMSVTPTVKLGGL